MLKRQKKYVEQGIVSCLVAILLLASAVSWGKILTKPEPQDKTLVVQEAKQASKKIRRGMMVFAGMVIVVAEYFQDDE